MIRRLINNSVLVVSISIVGVATVMLIAMYVFSVAQPIIDTSIISLSYVIGYGLVALTVIAICCATAIMLSGSFEFVGARWFSFLIAKSKAKRKLLRSEFEFRVLEKDQQGYIFSRPDSQFVGRNVSLESEPFTNNSLPSHNPISLQAWSFLNSPPAQPAQITNDSVPMLEAQPENSLNFEQVARKALASRGAGRFIAFGGMGSGKTTLAKHVVNYAMDEIGNRGGQVYVIDPHAPKIVWGDGLKVIGAGLDYQGIASFLNWIIEDVKARYEAGCGDDSKPLPEPFKPNFVICEEWAGVIAELQASGNWSDVHNRTFYQDARKAGIGFFLVAHEHTVKALGLQGMSNLLNGVEYFITLGKDAITDQYSATIGQSFKDKSPHTLDTPGPYNGRLYYSAMQIENEKSKTDKYMVIDQPVMPEFIVKDPDPDPDPEPEQRAEVIRKLHSEGLSKQAIAEHFGYKTCSGRIFYQIKDALNGEA